MRFIDYIVLALRNIVRQKLRSALTIFAVVIGATSVTIMLALVTGAKHFFTSQFEANGALQQVAVSAKADISDYSDASRGSGNNCDSCVKLTDPLVGKIEILPHVQAVARVATAGAFEAIIYNEKKLTVNQIKGYDANGVIATTMLAGRDISGSDKDGVVTITSDYADKFGYKHHYKDFVGKKVQLLTRDWYSGVGASVPKPSFGPGDNKPQQQPPTTLEATIVGITDSNNESQTIRAPLDWVRAMNTSQRWEMTEADRKANEAACRNHPGPCNSQQHITLMVDDFLARNGYDSLIVRADTTQNAASVAKAIKKLGVGAADAQTYIKSQLTVFNIIGLVLGSIGGIALAVAAIGVVNTMVMAILERTREIGVMRAVGARRSTIRRLFTFEAALLGFWGGVFGVGVGYVLTRIANIFINKQLASNSVQAHNIIGLPLWLILAVIGVTTIIGMLAGLYPAMRAARLDPVEALRYE